jgi:glutaredoxin-like protein NrdH
MPLVTVYSKPNCQACMATKKTLTRKGIPFDVIDVTEDQAAFDLIVSMGFTSAPVVIAGDLAWSGFQPDKINQLVQAATPDRELVAA